MYDLPKEGEEDQPVEYAVPSSNDAKVPGWLKLTYIILPIWGIFTFYFYWNGSAGWLDRGYWNKLQQAANTTFPFPTEQQELEKYEPRPPTSPPN